MSLYLKIILILFGVAYLISPVDIIPDLLLPYIGWLDDGVILWTVYYLIRYGRLPNYFFKNRNSFVNRSSQKPETHQKTYTQKNQAKTKQEKSSSNGKKYKSHGNTEKQSKSETTIPKTAWEILGLQKGAGKKEIQNAYREAIKKYHPDKLSHLGEEFSSLANEKFLEIQAAYDQLIKKSN